MRLVFGECHILFDNEGEPGFSVFIETHIPKRFSTTNDLQQNHINNCLGQALTNWFRTTFFTEDFSPDAIGFLPTTKDRKIEISIDFDPEQDSHFLRRDALHRGKEFAASLKERLFISALLQDQLTRDAQAQEILQTARDSGDFLATGFEANSRAPTAILNELTRKAHILWIEDKQGNIRSTVCRSIKPTDLRKALCEDSGLSQDSIRLKRPRTIEGVRLFISNSTITRTDFIDNLSRNCTAVSKLISSSSNLGRL